MTPMRSRSMRAQLACIISTAQHAKPNVTGHIEPVRAQLTSASTEVVTKPRSSRGFSPSGLRMSSTRARGSGLWKNCAMLMSFPLQCALLPFVDEAHDENGQENRHRHDGLRAQ